MTTHAETLTAFIRNAGVQYWGNPGESLDARADAKTALDAFSARLAALEKALRRLERWQPQTKVGMAALHPEHLEALVEARSLLAATGRPGETSDGR